MIKLTKGEKPDILKNNFDTWTNELLSYVNTATTAPDIVKGRYNHSDIKNAVKAESNDKCIYCESKISHVYFGDIEHIKPKSKYPKLTFEWSNLGYVCAKCNSEKNNTYDESLPFVNPYVDNPSNFFHALGIFVYHQAGNNRGEYTELKLKLNRPALIEARKERTDMIRSLLDKAANAEPLLRNIILEQIEIEIRDDKPYTFCVKSLYESFVKKFTDPQAGTSKVVL